MALCNSMDISTSLTYHITKTGNVLRQLSAKRIKDAGINLTPEESVLMNQLWDRDNQTMSELNLWSVKEASTLSRQIDCLVKKNYVERHHGTKDRRTVFVRLTPQGKQLQKQFNKTMIPNLDRDIANIPARDAAKLLKLLIEVRENALTELQE